MASHPVDVYVGKRLRLRRNMLGMSQHELGKKIGVTFQQVQKYERGVNRVGASRLFDFSQILSVPVGYFFEGFSVAENETSDLPVAAYGFAENGGEYTAEVLDGGEDVLGTKETTTLVRYFHLIKSQKIRKGILALVKSLAASD